MLAKLRDSFHAIRGLGHYLQPSRHIQQRHQPLSNDIMVFDNQHADRFGSHSQSPIPQRASQRNGTLNRIVVPSPRALLNSSIPPTAAARSFIPVNPKWPAEASP